MSWAYDVNGFPTWVPWIVGEPSNNQVPKWNSTLSRWVPSPAGGGTYTKTTDPTVSDDTTQSYVAGDIWVNTTGGRTYEAVDVTAGAALWRRTGGPAATLTSNAGTVGLYRFQGGLTDSSGNGYDLTSGSTWAYPYGLGGRQSAFTSGGIGANTNAAFKLVNNLTLEFLIKPTYTASFQTLLVNGNTKRRYYVDINNSATALRINFGYEWSGGTDAIEIVTPYQEWIHLVLDRTVSGGSTTLNGYVNGHLAMTETNAHTPDNTDAAATLYLGRNNAGVQTLTTCSLAGMHISTTVWTAAEVKQRTQLVQIAPGWGS